jgi:muramidase (phage lysozyme)
MEKKSFTVLKPTETFNQMKDRLFKRWTSTWFCGIDVDKLERRISELRNKAHQNNL